ncbi:alpha/beta hydrolase fold domain-containing protein [Cyclobacterium salsum]|uniref:alpha/beta hydrolase fold domain-containing protein n=1 Tax=Cyclobacterium salsum TaxID=2666329 RepID=UPI001390875C|nr:alpha/beta hydrolase fold domain-containing protein [Cyclobacterium salsum]
MAKTNQKTAADKNSADNYQVTFSPAENGSFSIWPEIPPDGMVKAGTALTIKASPASGYSLDAIYYTVKDGMWGTTSKEYFTPEVTLTVTKDMTLGAVFVEDSLVENIQVIQDVVYAQPGVKPLKYDVYSPKGARQLPAIVIIHGGGWSSNNEDIMRGLARELVKERKYVVFSIDYRWINKLDGDPTPNHMHQLIEDVFGAIAHIQEHALEYGANPTRIAVTGDSAGGHLSETAVLLGPHIGNGGFGEQEGLYAFMPSYIPSSKSVDQVKEEISRAIMAAAPSYGPSDAVDFKGFMEQTDRGYWDAVSPIRHVPYVQKRAIPHFIVRGTKDPLISHEMIQSYVEVLQDKGQKVSYIQVEGAGHAFFDWKPDAQTRATFARYGQLYAAEMRGFFDGIFY